MNNTHHNLVIPDFVEFLPIREELLNLNMDTAAIECDKTKQ